MRSIIINNPGEISLINSSIPEISDEDVLVKIKYVGFCGSDLSSFLGRNPMVNYPVIPGHEVAGFIEKKGKNVPGRFSEGDKVTIIPYSSCGKCASCKRGRSNACQHNQTLGVQRNGAMSEYVSVPWKKIIPSAGLTLKELALTEPLTVGFHAIARGRVTNTDTVAVLGCGIIGLGAIISAIDKGARVIAVDVDDKKLDLAKKIGAAGSINSIMEDIGEKLSSLTDGFGPDVIIEAAGQSETYLSAIESVAFTGRVVCIGYAKNDIAFATKLFVQKELDIMGSRNADLEDFKSVISYLGQRKLPTEQLISIIARPEEALNSMKLWADNPGKIFKILIEFH